MKRLLNYILILAFIPIVMLIIITPMDSEKQYLFAFMSILGLLALNLSKKNSVSMVMVFITILMSTRYIYFRAFHTLQLDSQIESILGLGLFLAELYSWIMLLLGYMQTIFPLERKIVPLPEDQSLWPTVDIYIPTYNESMDVVRDTVLAAQCINYPESKLKIYLLDDGNRSEFAVFATEVGVGYITRNENSHAKAGNLNHAMTLTNGELICIFDCDHVATRIFLQATTGAFLDDPDLALLQTPHYFYSPDPFKRNLYRGRDIPDEGNLFYGQIQKGNDTWNATFFCGSCAVIRRSALDEIGGFAVETVTEDAHTALKMQRLGWKSAYLGIPLAAGLATERVNVHVIQRNRWARGMTQIFRVDNPLFGRGLTITQRLCYLSAMLYFQFALPRIVYLTAPLAYLLFNLNIVHSSASLIVAYALPHFILPIFVNSRVSGRQRHSFWGEIYDLVLSFHLVIPTLLTMIFPKRGSFNVTDKGDLLDKDFFDFKIVRLHIIVAILLVFAICFGLYRGFDSSLFSENPYIIALNIGWAFYSLFFLLGAIAVARETKQVRKTIRLNVGITAIIHYESGIASQTKTIDLSMGGCQIKAPDDRHLTDKIEEIELILQSEQINIPVDVIYSNEHNIRLMFNEIPASHRRELVRVVLSRADAWIQPPSPHDNPLRSLLNIGRSIVEVFWSAMKAKDKKRIAHVAKATMKNTEENI